MSFTFRGARIHPSVFVAPGAVVLGDVTLGPRASVWFNTVVRGDSAPVVVGEATNLQDNSVVHEDEGLPALIGARVTVGHRSIIHGCVIGDDCLIGMGSVVLSGATIGAGSLIGAASLVRERQVIPPGSLVFGSPARVVGPVSDQHREAIRNGWSHYSELARFYMTRGLARAADGMGAVTRDLGPMTRAGWEDLLRHLEETPGWVANRLRGARVGDRTLAGILDLAAADRDVRLPLLDAISRGEEPEVAGLPVSAGRDGLRGDGGLAGALAAWREAREKLCGRLESLGPEAWFQMAAHPSRGAMSLAEVVREWVEEDLRRRRELGTPPADRG